MLSKHFLRKSLVAFFLGVIGFGLFPTTVPILAQSTTAASQEQNTTAPSESEQVKENINERNGIFELVTKVVYVLLWPLIALAGLAMDNQLVYGSFMYLDAPLRKVRNIIKNLANFFLGFVFLMGVLIYAISPEKKMSMGRFKGIDNPTTLIKKTLIAAVLIQASRFIMMVLVDLSTILTYTVGTIPTTVLATTDQKANYKVMGMSMQVNLGDAGKDANLASNESVQRYATLSGPKGVINIAPCMTTQRVKSINEKEIYIIGRKYDMLGSGTKMEPGYCNYMGGLVSYNESEIAESQQKSFAEKMEVLQSQLKDTSRVPDTALQDLIDAGFIVTVVGKSTSASQEGAAQPLVVKPAKLGEKITLISSAVEKQAGDCPVGFVSNQAKIDQKGNLIMNDGLPEYHCIFNDYGYSASEILEKTQSWTGPFVGLYGSLMSSSSFENLGNYTLYQKFLILLINAGFALVLILPLAGLVVVLLWRIMVLWIAIAVSPFLVIKEVFGEMLGDIGKDSDYFSVKEITKLLFAPVIVGFALSISLMFMTVLKSALPDGAKLYMDQEDSQSILQAQQAVNEISGIQMEYKNGNQELSLLGFIKMQIPLGLINFSRFLMMIFGLAITWFLMFWAVKYTKLGAQIGGQLESLGSKLLSTTPLIPVNGKMVGFGALGKEMSEKVNNITQAMRQEHDKRVAKAFGNAPKDGEDFTQEYFYGGVSGKAFYDSAGLKENMDKFNAMMDHINNTPSEQARQKASPQLKQLGLDTLAAINASNGSESQKMDAARQVSERLVQLGGVQHVGSEDLKKWFEEKKDSSGRVILREFKEENGTKNIIEKEYGLKDGKIYEMQKSESKLNDFLRTKKTHQEIFTEDQVVNNIDSFLEMENQHVVNEARYGKVDEYLERYQDAYVYLWEQVRTSSLKSDEKAINFNKLLSLKGLAQQPKPKALLANLYNRRSGKYEIEGKSYTYNASNNQFEIGSSSS